MRLLDEHIAQMIDNTAEKRSLTQKETLEQLMKEELEKIDEGEKRFKELAKKSGTPMTRKEYERRKAEREKARATEWLLLMLSYTQSTSGINCPNQPTKKTE